MNRLAKHAIDDVYDPAELRSQSRRARAFYLKVAYGSAYDNEADAGFDDFMFDRRPGFSYEHGFFRYPMTGLRPTSERCRLKLVDSNLDLAMDEGPTPIGPTPQQLRALELAGYSENQRRILDNAWRELQTEEIDQLLTRFLADTRRTGIDKTPHPERIPSRNQTLNISI